MDEPVYEYVKGSGWVPSTKPKSDKWCVIFKTPDFPWSNARTRGFSDTESNTVIALESYLRTYDRHIHEEGWEFKMVPYDGNY